MKIENESVFSNGFGMLGGNGLPAQSSVKEQKSLEITESVELKYGGENSSSISLATRMYADMVIKKALENIKSGENVYENKRIIEIFGHIVGEKSDKIIYG